MGQFGNILLLLSVVVLTQWIAKVLGNRIALPLVQILAGSILGLAMDLRLELDPALFFVLFLPPLLFLDGWRVPQRDLRANARTVLSLAFGLVFFTVLGLGYLLHFLLVFTPLPVCFALAAVLAPTDVVAATAMLAKVRVPNRVLRILQGEALFNDASGLVCLHLAVVATMTGAFSVWWTAGEVVWAAAGGITVGAAFSFLVSILKFRVTVRLGEEAPVQILISLLTPYGAFILADSLDCSSVLAAVAAGLVMSRVEVGGRALAETRIQRNAVWQTLQFVLNGAIFLLLGEQLPGILARAEILAGSGDKSAWLALTVLIVTVTLALLRFAWVWTSIFVWQGVIRPREQRREWPSCRLTTAMSVAGVRGAVSLAGALSLPLALPDGGAFPSRDLVIIIVAGVILLSLLSANILLPRMFRSLGALPEAVIDGQEKQARIAAAEAAIAVLTARTEATTASEEGLHGALAVVADHYRQRLDSLRTDDSMPQTGGNQERQTERVRVIAVRAERSAIAGLALHGRLSDDVAHKLLRETDLAELALRARLES
ncbi:Na+/H+ antiporter [Neoroseomonas lacus]|uniref:Na+/H+ antiporter n=1 Tax=Neoroseomonas lacus TaxID=287609 RepID=A0A917NJ92_9PROT|nr:Na+/H+ antiporter [Neoroseomonas lacus]GGJ04982.1 Na+/H+ antiporter [Neoroseomonas lacus]